jgi:hypothetical protein
LLGAGAFACGISHAVCGCCLLGVSLGLPELNPLRIVLEFVFLVGFGERGKVRCGRGSRARSGPWRRCRSRWARIRCSSAARSCATRPGATASSHSPGTIRSSCGKHPFPYNEPLHTFPESSGTSMSRTPLRTGCRRLSKVYIPSRAHPTLHKH